RSPCKNGFTVTRGAGEMAGSVRPPDPALTTVTALLSFLFGTFIGAVMITVVVGVFKVSTAGDASVGPGAFLPDRPAHSAQIGRRTANLTGEALHGPTGGYSRCTMTRGRPDRSCRGWRLMRRDQVLSEVLREFARTMVTSLAVQGILDQLVGPVVAVLPVSGAGVTAGIPGAGGGQVAASDRCARRLQELQTEL